MARFSASGPSRRVQIIHHLSAPCNQIFEQSLLPLTPPHTLMQATKCFLCLSVNTLTTPSCIAASSLSLSSGARLDCGNLMPSFHISNSQSNHQRVLTQASRLQAEHGKTCAIWRVQKVEGQNGSCLETLYEIL